MKLKRLLSVMLSCVIAFQLLPASALAQENASATKSEEKSETVLHRITVKKGLVTSWGGSYSDNLMRDAGEKITLKYDHENCPGECFVKWKVNKGNITLPDSSYCTFVMPDEDVEIEAVVEKGYSVQIINGTTNIDGLDVSKFSAKPGTIINAEMKEKKYYCLDFWQETYGDVEFSSTTTNKTQFTMINQDVIVGAIYKRLYSGWSYHNGWMYGYYFGGGYAKNTLEEIDGEYYYFDENGHYVTGWQYIYDRWYYFDPHDGHRHHDEYVDDCYLGPWGDWIKIGWQYDGTGWCYLNKKGYYEKNFEEIDGEWYFFDQSAYLKTGWLYIGGQYYFLHYEDGRMARSEVVNGQHFDENGYWFPYGWYYDGTGWSYYNEKGYRIASAFYQMDGQWYFFDENGHYVTGWNHISGKWYFFYFNDGHMAQNETTPDGYYVNESGEWVPLNDNISDQTEFE